MPAYFIANYQITDPNRYQNEYIPQVMPIMAKHGGKPIVVDMEVNGVEGSPQHFIVVIEFPNRAAAEAWHNDPDYQPVAAIRHESAANAWAAICDQFVPPGS
ncbi:DUF1330 domain-containing protein [bacterium SCSIO 12741]|nr:DUF1330 domain-containing protein [bacterium SCSIO 12741]